MFALVPTNPIKADCGLTALDRGVQHRPMPTPLFTIRLAADVQNALRDMAKVYGSPNASAFAREMLTAMTSGDVEQVKVFNQRLIARAGEQLVLTLNAALDERPTAKKPAKTARTRPKGGRRRPRAKKRA